MDRVLFLTANCDNVSIGGREMLGETNFGLLRELLGERLVRVRPPHRSSGYWNAWRGYIDGIDDPFIDQILSIIATERITQMFVDGSNFGAAIAAVKRAAPHVRISTFFHNVEARFFWGAVRANKSIRSVAVMAANYIAERKAVCSSDVLICLSARDSTGLSHLYGRGADHIAPIVVADESTPTTVAPESIGTQYILFVGGAFYANIAGIRWFAREVAPRIKLAVKIVGRGMKELEDEFRDVRNITLVGAVESLAPWYAGAALIVAPIFDGSGMKTKVAEALMYGKHVAGSPEAFSGYAADIVAANVFCADADSFVAAIDAVQYSPLPAFDPLMRRFYERDHSPAAARKRLAGILSLPDQTSSS